MLRKVYAHGSQTRWVLRRNRTHDQDIVEAWDGMEKHDPCDEISAHGSSTRPVFVCYRPRVDLNTMARGGISFVTARVEKY